MIYLTTWCDDEVGAEWDIKIEYRLTRYKPQIDDPGHDLFGPEEPTEVEIIDIYRYEPYAINGVETGMQWVEWNGESDAELEDWEIEILEDTSDY